MELFFAAIIGVLAGTHTATWGMYKDSPYEGFSYRKYFRSILSSLTIALVLEFLLDFELTLTGNILILFGLTYVLERAAQETYKSFVREEDQSKYTIPMQFSIRGKVVQSRALRLLSGVLYIGVICLIFSGIYALQKSNIVLPRLIMIATIGSVGGWISACGGAWKDAPIEGFEILKFFRSPVLACFFAFIISFFTDNYAFICACSLGYTIASIESYKTFLQGNKTPGKFAGKEIKYPDSFEKRKPYVFVFWGIWIGLVTITSVSFGQLYNA